MASKLAKENDLKKIIKNLFLEKKKETELHKRLEDKCVQKKIQSKFAKSHRSSFIEEYAKLKAACFSKETECAHLKTQIEKVKPALKKIIDELHKAHAEIDELKKKDFSQNDNLKAALDEAHQKVQLLNESLTEQELLREQIIECSYVKLRELSERNKDVLLELEHMQNRTEKYIKMLNKFEQEHISLQTALKNTKLQCEERDAEIRKAQQHLAKKVKENTILHDLAEKQKMHLHDLQILCDRQTNELARMQNSLSLQKMHEEKLQLIAKERTQAAETVSKEWQEKCLALQQDWQEKKAELIELQKMRKTYDQMATALSNLKNILGNSCESPTTIEEPQNSGH